MSSLAHMYDDFSAFQGMMSGAEARPDPEDLLEDQRLEAFEDGYKSGWEDAVKATREERAQLSADFVQQFQDLSFTYHEAHAKLSATLAPLLSSMVAKLLPEMMQPALCAQVLDQIRQLIDTQTDAAITLAVAPANLSVIEELLAGQVAIPFSLKQDADLSNGQISLRVGVAERDIDLAGLTASITSAVNAFIHASEPERHHG